MPILLFTLTISLFIGVEEAKGLPAQKPAIDINMQLLMVGMWKACQNCNEHENECSVENKVMNEKETKRAYILKNIQLTAFSPFRIPQSLTESSLECTNDFAFKGFGTELQCIQINVHEIDSVRSIAIVDGIAGGAAMIPHNAILLGVDIPHQH